MCVGREGGRSVCLCVSESAPTALGSWKFTQLGGFSARLELLSFPRKPDFYSSRSWGWSSALHPCDLRQRRTRALATPPPQDASLHSFLFCIIFMWLSELNPAVTVDLSLGSGAGPGGAYAPPPGQRAGCSASGAGFAARWPPPSPGPPPAAFAGRVKV